LPPPAHPAEARQDCNDQDVTDEDALHECAGGTWSATNVVQDIDSLEFERNREFHEKSDSWQGSSPDTECTCGNAPQYGADNEDE
jgi:hypothetical protein